MQKPQITLTEFKETVLERYFPDVFQHTFSQTIYKNFVGLSLPEDKLFVVLGTDSGLLVDYLSQIATPGQRFILLDHAPVVEWLKENKAINSKMELYAFDDFDFEILYEKYQDYVIRNAIILLKSLVVDRETALYQGLFSVYEEQFQRFRIDRVDNRDFKKVFNQQLENVCDLVHPLQVIKDRLKGEVPGIILGGGPSLDQIIPWLKVNQNKVWIFAASRICKRLLKEGITPDFIASLDPQPLIFEYSKEMYQFADQSILITGEHPYPRLIQQWKGLKTYTRRRFPWAKGSEDNFISDGPTVTNAMFGMAVYLGVSNLYLGGVDFCFTLEGVCHESGSIESQMGIRDYFDTQAINYRGEKVGTNIQLYDARNLFEEQFAKLSKTWTGLQAYNLNSGAAVVNGIDYQSIESLDLSVDKFDVVDAFKFELQDTAESQKKFLRFLTMELNKATNWLEQIAKKAKTGVHLTSILFKDIKKQPERINDVLKIKQQLENYVGVDYQTMVNYAYVDFMETLQPVESEEAMSQQEMTNALMGFFGGLQKGSEGFLERILSIRNEINFRKSEMDPSTHFPELAQKWLTKGVPGRFYVWLESIAEHSYEYYLSKFPNEVKALESDYEELVHDDSQLKTRFESRLSDPQEYVLQILKAFEQKMFHPIEKVIRQLQSLPKEHFQAVKLFAEGTLFELQNHPEQALEKYLKADPEKTKAYVLQRLFPLAFTLSKYDLALETLEVLCRYDKRYMPFFADALALLGNVEGAIQTYQAYPLLKQDTSAVIHLLKLYVQVGQVDLANALLSEAECSPLLNQQQLQSFVDGLNETS